MRTAILLLTLLLSTAFSTAWSQPCQKLHTNSKKAEKLYRRAMERSREAMAPGADKEAARREVEADLIKCLDIDPEFAEAERVMATLLFDAGAFEASRDRYAHYLTLHGSDFIRDHFSWAESARHALDPISMKQAMNAMQAIPGVMEGPDVERISRMVKDAEFMSEALQQPVPIAPEPLPSPVSTMEDEYFPSVWLAGEALVFTRKVEDARWQQGQEDLFVTRRTADGWEVPQPLRGLNTLANEGAASLSGDGMTLCFTVCREPDRPGQGAHKGSCDLYISQQVGGQWSTPINLEGVNSPAWESQPCLSPDGQSLYFTRGSGKPGRRKYDLFVARRGADGKWGQGIRLGGAINSNGVEMRPFIHPDGRHFYFASDGRPGMGGMDLFVSTMDGNGQWGEPVNLGWPLNTPDDESGLVVASDGTTAYFSREVDGQLDLHALTLPKGAASDPTAAMEGRLLDPAGRGLSGGRVNLVDRVTGEPFASAEAASDGRYHVPVPMDRAFVVLAEAPGHLLHSESMEVGMAEGRIERDIVLEPLRTGVEVVLRNVFFDSGSAELDAESHAELARVGAWLEAHPTIRVEVGGHTDDVGSDAANLTLSQQRAERVEQALRQAGADAGQLEAKGYGRSQPAAEGTSGEARRQNRRTALRVISAGG